MDILLRLSNFECRMNQQLYMQIMGTVIEFIDSARVIPIDYPVGTNTKIRAIIDAFLYDFATYSEYQNDKDMRIRMVSNLIEQFEQNIHELPLDKFVHHCYGA